MFFSQVPFTIWDILFITIIVYLHKHIYVCTAAAAKYRGHFYQESQDTVPL